MGHMTLAVVAVKVVKNNNKNCPLSTAYVVRKYTFAPGRETRVKRVTVFTR